MTVAELLAEIQKRMKEGYPPRLKPDDKIYMIHLGVAYEARLSDIESHTSNHRSEPRVVQGLIIEKVPMIRKWMERGQA